APGLTVLQNGGSEWDNGPTMYIRGLGGLSGNENVLVLVDGFERPLSSINKDDVENIQVLKDAAATTIYGLRGTNGVILVNTKKGIYEKTEIAVSYDHAFASPVGLPNFVDAYTYASGMNEARRLDGAAPEYNEYAMERFRTGDSPYLYPNVDWMNEIYRQNGATNQYNVSIRGGGSKARYYGSMNLISNSGFMKQESVFSDNNTQMLYSKMNTRINLDIDITPLTDFIVRMNGILAEQNVPGSGYSFVSDLYSLPSAAFPIKTESGAWGSSDIWTSNPVARSAASGNTIYHSRSLSSDAELRQRLDPFVEGLSFGARVGYDNYAQLNDATTRTYAYEIQNITYGADGLPSLIGKTTGGKDEANSFSHGLSTQWRRFAFEAAAYYHRVWEKSKLDANLVYSLENYTGTGQNNITNRMHYGLSAHYGYLNRYFIDGAFAISGSNQLPPDDKYGYFPAVSAAWLASEEDFLKANSFVNFLKLRASWGITGRDYRPEANMYRQTFGSGTGYPFTSTETNTSGMKENRYPSYGMTYEKAYKSNVGMDVLMFKNLDLTVDAFLENRRDILVLSSGTLSSLIGQSLPYANVGAVDNKGVELGLTYSDRIGDFTYQVSGNFAYTRSKVIESGEEFKPDEYSREKGRPVSQIFGYEASGYYTADDFDADGILLSTLPANALYKDLAPGDVKLVDKNGDNVINEYDRTYIGYNSVCPEIYYSASISLEYKGIGIDALLQGATNYTAQLTLTGLYRPLTGNTTMSQYYYDNRWTPETPNARFPRLTLLDNANNTAMSTVWITDRSFAKLRHCEVYYRFTNDWLFGALGIKDVKLYVRGLDLLTFSNITETDPELLSSGYPLAKSINLGCKITF
ncbi:MAG: SusC/RagA family TonB-linked outer membrane protein, partial [Candidatus Symbiothrix sp.]|nr:SusC/RagA family TonB-linked outer membrane protein [Candidatus Symbiothrix sp.]